MHLWSLVVVALAPVALTKPLAKRWDDFQVKHAWVETPSGWEVHGDAPADHRIDMRIGLKQDKFDELVEHLYQVSDPSHERYVTRSVQTFLILKCNSYGAHLSKEEVEALVAPHPDSVDLVESWLLHHGVSPSSIERSPAGDWLKLTVSVSQAERMLDAKYRVFRNPATSDYVVRTTAYSLPAALHSHVSVVTPTTYFGSLRKMKATSFLQPEIPPIDDKEAVRQHEALALGGLAAVPSSCSTTITPACLRALYNTSTYTPQATNVNKLGVAGYLEEFANNADLQVN